MKRDEIINWKQPGMSTSKIVQMFREPKKSEDRYPPRDPDIDVSQRGVKTDSPDPANFNLIATGQRGAVQVDKTNMVRYLKACKVVYDKKVPYIYDGRTYVRCTDSDIARLIYQALESITPRLFISRSAVADIIANLSATSTKFDIQVPNGWDPDGKYDTELVPFDNGLYSIDLDEMLPFSPYVFVKHRLDTMYMPKMREHKASKVYESILPNEKTRQFFFEMVGFMLFSGELRPPAIFLTYGPGQTGKSALQETVVKAAGRQNVSTLDLAQISGTFTTAEMQDKLINICGETGSGMSREISKADGELLKKLTDGQTITVQRKNKDPYEMTNSAKLWFVSNTLPDFGDTSSGLLRRLYIIPCRVPQNWEDQIYDKLQEPEALIWLMTMAMDGYIRFLNRGRRFAVSDEMRREGRSYKTQDSIMDFIDQRFNTVEPEVICDRIEGSYLSEIYDDYRAMTMDGGGKAFSKRKFLEKLRNEFGLEIEKVRSTKEDGKPTNLMVFKRR